jgi:hypothetical protein
MSQAPQTPEGVHFPHHKDGSLSGTFSSTQVGKAIFADSIQSVQPFLASAIQKEKQWRKHYIRHVEPMTEIAIENQKNATTIANEGLRSAYHYFKFYRDNKEQPLAVAMGKPKKGYFHTAKIEGNFAHTESLPTVSIPYKQQNLENEALLSQLAKWSGDHILETSHSESIMNVVKHSEYQDLRNHYFVLLGAGSEVGPMEYLLSRGANIIAIDLDRKATWQQLIKKARNSYGTLYIPTLVDTPAHWNDDQIAEVAGANLLTQTPEIADWLSGFDHELVIGSYAYLDGANHVRVVMAMDAISQRLMELNRPIKLAYLLTPTDVFAVPEEVCLAAKYQYDQWKPSKPLKSLLKVLSANKLFKPNIRKEITSQEGKRYGVVNSLLSQQGTSYVLAKRIQRWRAISARQQGAWVSCNIAPATATVSVVKNKMFDAAFKGLGYFGGEVFQPETTNALMALLLMNDIQSVESAANPDKTLINPEELFIHGANHGGFWRMANQLSSVLEIGFILGTAKKTLNNSLFAHTRHLKAFRQQA